MVAIRLRVGFAHIRFETDEGGSQRTNSGSGDHCSAAAFETAHRTIRFASAPPTHPHRSSHTHHLFLPFTLLSTHPPQRSAHAQRRHSGGQRTDWTGLAPHSFSLLGWLHVSFVQVAPSSCRCRFSQARDRCISSTFSQHRESVRHTSHSESATQRHVHCPVSFRLICLLAHSS